MRLALAPEFNRGINRFLDVPLESVYSRTHCVAADAKMIGDICKASGESINSKAGRVRPIAHLLMARGPSAVLRTVGAIIVDAIDAVIPFRSIPNVSNKTAEPIPISCSPPRIANGNPTPAVVSVINSARDGASFDHFQPFLVERVRPRSVLLFLILHTAAAFAVSTLKPVRHIKALASALAAAQNTRIDALVGKNGQIAVAREQRYSIQHATYRIPDKLIRQVALQ